MKIALRAEKSGAVLARGEFDVKDRKDALRNLKDAKKLFETFVEEHPQLPLFDNDFSITFERIDE